MLLHWTPRCQTVPSQTSRFHDGLLEHLHRVQTFQEYLKFHTLSQSLEDPFGLRGLKHGPVKLLRFQADFLNIFIVCKPLKNILSFTHTLNHRNLLLNTEVSNTAQSNSLVPQRTSRTSFSCANYLQCFTINLSSFVKYKRPTFNKQE